MQESHLSSHQPAWPARGQGREADNGGRLCYTYGLITSNSSDRCCDDSKLIWKLIIKAGIILTPIWFRHHGTWPATGHSARCRTLLLIGLIQWQNVLQPLPWQQLTLPSHSFSQLASLELKHHPVTSWLRFQRLLQQSTKLLPYLSDT